MKNIVFLEYTFMFEPSSTWTNLYQFEQDLANFFAAHGMEAEILKAIEGNASKRILLISKIQLMPAQDSKPIGRPKQPGSQFKDLSKRNLRAPAYKFMGKDFKKETK